MHTQKAVVTYPHQIQPGDRVFTGGRGPWGRVNEVRSARGRPLKDGTPRVRVITTRGEVTLPVTKPVRVIRCTCR